MNQIAHNITDGGAKALRKHCTIKASRKSAEGVHRHASCKGVFRRIARLGFGSLWFAGTNRTGHRRSNVERRGRWERDLSSVDLEGERFYDVDEYAFGKLQEKMWTYSGWRDIDEVGRKGKEEFFIEYTGTNRVDEKEFVSVGSK